MRIARPRPARRHVGECVVVAAVVGVAAGGGAPRLGDGALEEALAEEVVLKVAVVGRVELKAGALFAAETAVARRLVGVLAQPRYVRGAARVLGADGRVVHRRDAARLRRAR
eukprot:2199061-Prymnesium_polylepis.2